MIITTFASITVIAVSYQYRLIPSPGHLAGYHSNTVPCPVTLGGWVRPSDLRILPSQWSARLRGTEIEHRLVTSDQPNTKWLAHVARVQVCESNIGHANAVDSWGWAYVLVFAHVQTHMYILYVYMYVYTGVCRWYLHMPTVWDTFGIKLQLFFAQQLRSSHRHVTRQLAEGRHTVDATDDDGGMLYASGAAIRRASPGFRKPGGHNRFGSKYEWWIKSCKTSKWCNRDCVDSSVNSWFIWVHNEKNMDMFFLKPWVNHQKMGCSPTRMCI